MDARTTSGGQAISSQALGSISALYKREPVICNMLAAVVLMLVNHLAFSYSGEVKGIIDIAMTGLTGVSRQLVSPFYASPRRDNNSGSDRDNGDEGPDNSHELSSV